MGAARPDFSRSFVQRQNPPLLAELSEKFNALQLANDVSNGKLNSYKCAGSRLKNILDEEDRRKNKDKTAVALNDFAQRVSKWEQEYECALQSLETAHRELHQALCSMQNLVHRIAQGTYTEDVQQFQYRDQLHTHMDFISAGKLLRQAMSTCTSIISEIEEQRKILLQAYTNAGIDCVTPGSYQHLWERARVETIEITLWDESMPKIPDHLSYNHPQVALLLKCIAAIEQSPDCACVPPPALCQGHIDDVCQMFLQTGWWQVERVPAYVVIDPETAGHAIRLRRRTEHSTTPSEVMTVSE